MDVAFVRRKVMETFYVEGRVRALAECPVTRYVLLHCCVLLRADVSVKNSAPVSSARTDSVIVTLSKPGQALSECFKHRLESMSLYKS